MTPILCYEPGDASQYFKRAIGAGNLNERACGRGGRKPITGRIDAILVDFSTKLDNTDRNRNRVIIRAEMKSRLVRTVFGAGIILMAAEVSADNAEEFMDRKVQSDFLFAQPSFASGAGRVLDLWGQFDDYNHSDTPAEADAKALATDWFIVGQDIRDATDASESEVEAEITAA